MYKKEEETPKCEKSSTESKTPQTCKNIHYKV